MVSNQQIQDQYKRIDWTQAAYAVVEEGDLELRKV